MHRFPSKHRPNDDGTCCTCLLNASPRWATTRPPPRRPRISPSCDACAASARRTSPLVAMARAERDAARHAAHALGGHRRRARRRRRVGRPARRIARRAHPPGLLAGWPLQAAAGLLLLAGGAMIGRVSAGAPLVPARVPRTCRGTASHGGARSPARRARDAAGRFGVRVGRRGARGAAALRAALPAGASAFLARYDSTAVATAAPSPSARGSPRSIA